MKYNLKKRILAFLLAVVMLIGMVPVTGMTAYAAKNIELSTGMNTPKGVSKITVKNIDGNLVNDANPWKIELENKVNTIDLEFTNYQIQPNFPNPTVTLNGKAVSGNKASISWENGNECTANIVVSVNNRNFNYSITFVLKQIITVSEIKLPENIDINVNESVDLGESIEINPADATSSIKWESSNSDIATVDKDGNVTGKRAGTATITASADGVSATCELTVKNKPVINVYIETTSTTEVALGHSITLNAIVEGDPTFDGVTWSSSDDTYVSVDEEGVVTGLKETEEGKKVTITATTNGEDENENKLTATCELTVKKHSVTGVTLSGVPTEPVSIGETAQLTANIEPETAYDKTVEWTSSDPEKVKVDENGLITAIDATEGNEVVTITAKSKDNTEKSAICEVKVKPVLVNSISIGNIPDAFYKGDSWKLTAEFIPGNTTNKAVEWSSSDETVVSVDQKGNIRALKEGTAIITVKSLENNSVTASYTFNIVEIPAHVLPLNITTFKGGTLTNGSINRVAFTDNDGNPIEVQLRPTFDKESKTISVILKKTVEENAKIKANFELTQNGELPFLTTKTGTSGTSSGKAWDQRRTVFDAQLSNGKAATIFYLYNVKPSTNNNQYETYRINYEIVNNLPILTGERVKTDTVVAETPYTINLDGLFADADGDVITYKVSVDGSEYTPVEGTSYTFETSKAKDYEICFKANDGQDDSLEVYKVNLAVTNSEITYNVNVRVSANIAPTFTITDEIVNGYDVSGSTILEAVIDEAKAENGFDFYTVKVPSNVYRISVRGVDKENVDWGGLSFATQSEDKTQIEEIITLRQMQGTIKTLINNDTPDASQAQFKVKTSEDYYAVSGGTGIDPTYKYLYYRFLLIAYGEEEYYTYYTQASGNLGKTYGTNQSSNRVVYDESASIDVTPLPLALKSAFTINAPKEATVKMFYQNQNYNVTEVSVHEIKDNGDGTSSWVFLITNADNMSYRVSMEGKITKAGYVEGDSVTIIWDEDDLGPKDRVKYDLSTTYGARGDDSLNLNINERNNLVLNENGSFRLRAYRIWQIINTDTMNKMIEPDFTYKVLNGDNVISITPVTTGNGNATNNWLDIRAKENGVAILEVGYDALNIPSGKESVSGGAVKMGSFTFNAVDPMRTGLAVIQVGNAANDVNFNIECLSKYSGSAAKWDAEHDTLYFVGDKGELKFSPTVGSGAITEVAVSNDKGATWTVLTAVENCYTASIATGNNILRVKTDHGDSYHVVRGDKLTLEYTDADGDGVIEAGEKISVTLDGLHMAIGKMSGIYNPTGILTYYTLNNQEIQGTNPQYCYSKVNLEVTIPDNAVIDSEVVLENGYTYFSGYAIVPGQHRKITDSGTGMNGAAETTRHARNILPEITIIVGSTIEAKEEIPNTAPTLADDVDATKNTATVKVGEKYSLNLKDIFKDAENDKLTYSVTINENTAPATASYTYIPSAKGEYTLVFKATDGEFESDSYTVVLTVTESEAVSKELKFDTEGLDIVGTVTISMEDYAVRLEDEMDRIDPVYQNPLGIIIEPVEVPFAAYDTIAEVTLRLFKAMEIKASYIGTAYSSFYLTSIGNFVVNDIYYEEMGEFKAGQGSGWMITWNTGDEKGDWFINKGASDFVVNDGDVIKWKYTCQYGADIGDNGYLKEADNVMDLINEIKFPITTESETAILKARDAYDALIPVQQVLVENYDILVKAEKKLAELKTSDEEKVAADEVNSLIQAIGNTITKDSKEAIDKAREAYNALTDNAKPLCDIETLETAENLYAQLVNGEKVTDVYNSTGNYLSKLGIPAVGTTGGEWMIIGLARGNKGLSGTVTDGYYNGVSQYIDTVFSGNKELKEAVRLHENKSTDNARVIVGLTAAGIDATDVNGYNLFDGLDDLSYIKYQGINGPMWALIAFKSHPSYKDEFTSEFEGALIQAVLESQLKDGGWDLTNKAADADMTAMAIQALAPYYDSKAKVKEAVDKALSKLSSMQQPDGSFASVDGINAESTAQVIVALTSLGINPEEDSRFIKKGMSPVDALCNFAVSGGGFMHTPNTARDGMATEQGYYALVSYFRLLNPNQTSLYDMSDVALKIGKINPDAPSAYDIAKANEVEKLISAIGKVTLYSNLKIEAARKAYGKLTAVQKKQVENYDVLVDAEKKYEKLVNEAVEKVEDMIYSIGEVTLESGDDITAARRAYNQLPPHVKKLVKNFKMLEKAEKEYKKLREEALELIRNGKTILTKSELLELQDKFENVSEKTKYDDALALLITYFKLGEKQQLALAGSEQLETLKSIVAKQNHENPSTGITMYGLEWNIKVKTDKLPEKDEHIKDDIISKLGDAQMLTIWDIHLEDVLTGKGHTLDDVVEVCVPVDLIGDYTFYDRLGVVHYADDGSIEVLNCKIVDGYVVFDAVDFSYYAIVGFMDAENKSEMTTGTVVVDTPEYEELIENAEEVQNADNNWLVWAGTAGVGIVLLAVLLVLKKRMSKES